MDLPTNGHGGGNARLRKLLAHHEQIAAEQNKIVESIRTTLAMLAGHDVVTKVGRAPSVLADAIAIDTARRRGRPKGSKMAERVAGRARTHEFLAHYREGDVVDRETAVKLGALVTYGYLRTDDAGNYVRTAKPHYRTENEARRQATGAEAAMTMSAGELMASMAPRDRVPDGALKFGKGVLVRHGYLKKLKDGTFVRTAKPYPPTGSSAEADA
jgi:hypothetical protein